MTKADDLDAVNLVDILPANLNPRGYKTDLIVDANLLVLSRRLTYVQALWGRQLTITSGLRDGELQKKLIAEGRTKATKSKHLSGEAADVLDADDTLKAWLIQNPDVLIEAQLWCEHGDYTKGWCHMQIIPPRSGKRWFIP